MVLSGIVCPMMSPIDSEGRVNRTATAALTGHLLAGPVDAILVAGTTGEFHCLSDAAWSSLIDVALCEIAGAVPVLVNVSHCSVRVAAERARHAARQGATYVTSIPPYYVPLGNDGLVAFYQHLADASSVPLVLYNIPQFTKCDLMPVLPILAEHPNIVGIKESSGLLEGLTAIPRRVGRPFIRLAGTDVLLPAAVAQQIDGVVPGLANVIPRLYRQWWDTLESGDRAHAHDSEAGIHAFTDLYAAVPGAAPHMAVYRSGLRLLGIDPGSPCGIDASLPEHVQRQLEAALANATQLAP